MVSADIDDPGDPDDPDDLDDPDDPDDADDPDELDNPGGPDDHDDLVIKISSDENLSCDDTLSSDHVEMFTSFMCSNQSPIITSPSLNASAHL